MTTAPAAAIAVTMGEPSGIGGEITIKAWLKLRAETLTPFFLIADPHEIEAVADRLGIVVPIRQIDASDQAASVFSEALPILPISLPKAAVPGALDPDNAAAVLASIERAVRLAMSGDASAVVTNPIHKGVVAKSGFTHGGHTDFLKALTNSSNAEMMLVSPRLKVVPATVHVGLREAIAGLSTPRLSNCLVTTARALQTDFGIAEPRVAVAGLNPHAGEGGLFGIEEGLVVEPAIDTARQAGIDVIGPLPADSMFHDAARKAYDVAVCMYHDQALIPLKTLDFERAVNITLGLPIVRTSPDHGTALDIAGRGIANATSLIEALKLAQRVAERRRSAP